MSPRAAPPLALAAALLGAGCLGGYRRELPPEFPRREQGGGLACPRLEGRWEARAAEDPFAWDEANLLLLLGLPASAPADGRHAFADWVELAQPAPDRLEVRPGRGDRPLGEPVSLRRGVEYECRDGALRAARPPPWENGNVCAARSWRSATLWRDEGGGLVVRRGAVELCIGLANALTWSAEWARFRPAPR